MIKNALLFIACMTMLVACSRSPTYKKEAGIPSSARSGQTPEERNKILEKAQNFNAPKKRAVILPFWNNTPVKGRFEVLSKNALKNVLLEQGRVNLVDEKDVPLRSEDFYLDPDKINVEHVVENGRKWGVSLIILGRITKIVFRRQDEDVGFLRPSKSMAAANVELRLVDVTSGKEVAIGQGAGTSESSSLNVFGVDREENDDYRDEIVTSAIEDAIKKAVPILNREIDRIQWRGRIVKVIGNRVYVNAGRSTGINVGDILKVTTPGTDIYDNESGLFLGRTQGELKGTLEVDDYFGEDGAATRVHSGGNFQEGDFIQLY
jgi:hypothetical protein